jgi:hypothetical protein
MDICAYCGEEKRALKNHVRLASGDGHGPSGTYPDDFEDGTSPGPRPASQDGAEGRESGADAGEGEPSSEEGVSPSPEAEASHSSPQDDVGAPSDDASGDLPATADSDTVEMTPEELDEMIETAAAEGYEEGANHGYEAGQTDAQREQESIEVESTVEDVDTGTTTTSRSGCPECGGRLDTDVAGNTFFAVDGQVVTLEEGDGLCENCDVVVGNDGEVIYGSESKKADPTPACSKCGNGTVSAEHALHLIGGYYQKRSSLRVFARRRLKKIAGNIEKQNPSYVCPSCWTAFG